MSTEPRDTSPEARARQRAVLRRLGPQGRVSVAIELSESVRAIHLAGLRARNPSWDEKEAVRRYIEAQFGVEMPVRP